MKVSTLIAAVAGIVIPLQGATFYYVLSVESRLTRLETIIGAPRPAPRIVSPEVES